ncbi:MAG: ATP-binding protein, partial [Anaeroplasma sp.]
MLYRKSYEIIKEWYFNSEKALLIDGARQVGKTTLIRSFFEENNIMFTEINLHDNQSALDAFNTSKDSKELLVKIIALADKNVEDGMVFFIDEIQEADDAITPIKFLIDSSSYKFVFSGSLLGVKMKNIQSIGVGYITIHKMYPMDFEEFCTANGVSKKTIDYLYDCFIYRKTIDSTVHEQMMKLFNLYLIVGGMPGAVNTYVTTHNLKKVSIEHNDIDQGYLKDITKYDCEEKLLIEDIYNLIPSELNQQNKRMILKNLNAKARFYQYEESFIWLLNSGVGLFTYNVDNPVYPLLASKERTLFKLFLCDVGLLSTKLLNGNQIKILNGNVNLNFGAIYENVVAQELVAHGYELFFSN